MSNAGENSEIIIGIDLGTTNSLVAFCDGRGARILPDENGEHLVPSAVRFEPGASPDAPPGLLVGARAKLEAQDHPRRTVLSVKRLMGRSLEDASGDARFLSYEVVPGERGHARIRVPLPGGDGHERTIETTPEEVSAAILARLREIAERNLGRPVNKAVVTVPAYFDDAQRQATRVAGRLAGLDVVRLVPEPTAAALAYGLGLGRGGKGPRPEIVVVYDFGGGTFDVSVLELTGGEDDQTAFYQVLSTSGDTHLGGDDIDHMVVGVLREGIARVLGASVELPPGVRRQLVAMSERVKIRLSEETRAEVRIDLGESKRLEQSFTREEFEGMISALVERTLECCRRAMADAERKLRGRKVDAVVMVGGSTRIPLVRRRVGEFFGIEPYTAINPDEVVALGAGVQAAVLSGSRKGSLLLDVIPLSLGIETAGGAVAKIIMRNSTVPAQASEMFSTNVDGQTSIRLTVYQGEREMAADCRRLGEFHLRGIPPMPAGIPQVDVRFLVDANGVLNVSAAERRSGRRATMQVIPNHGLTPEEVDRIERESVRFAREDMTRHRIVDLCTNSDLDLKWIGERLARHRGELEPAYASELESRITDLRGKVEAARADWKSVDAGEFQKAKEGLDRASLRLQEVSIAASLRGGAGPA